MRYAIKHVKHLVPGDIVETKWGEFLPVQRIMKVRKNRVWVWWNDDSSSEYPKNELVHVVLIDIETNRKLAGCFDCFFWFLWYLTKGNNENRKGMPLNIVSAASSHRLMLTWLGSYPE